MVKSPGTALLEPREASDAPATSPVTAVRNGVRVDLRVAPKAARPGVAGMGRDAEGRPFLKVGVGAPPEGGKANRELVKMLAKAWRLPAGSITIAAGATQRRKVLVIEGDPERLLSRLSDWMKDLDE